ncbi:MAG: excisionase family DNA-binding protein [Ignavibacteriales bacterium]|nr:excisionase family DNA-binding protein [Ignavibacteriales bacterium]
MENSEIALLSISKAAKELHIGKDRIYKLLNEGRLGWVPMGNKRFIPTQKL